MARKLEVKEAMKMVYGDAMYPLEQAALDLRDIRKILLEFGVTGDNHVVHMAHAAKEFYKAVCAHRDKFKYENSLLVQLLKSKL